MGASVKVMLSHDYCHFEISKSSDQDLTNEQIDLMRKDCMRLADKAIEQYKISKANLNSKTYKTHEFEMLKNEVEKILLKSEGDRTVNEIAKVKHYQDKNWTAYINNRYDYQDDWGDEQQ